MRGGGARCGRGTSPTPVSGTRRPPSRRSPARQRGHGARRGTALRPWPPTPVPAVPGVPRGAGSGRGGSPAGPGLSCAAGLSPCQPRAAPAFDVPLKRHCPRPAGSAGAGEGSAARPGVPARRLPLMGTPRPSNGPRLGPVGMPVSPHAMPLSPSSLGGAHGHLQRPLNGSGETGTSCSSWGQRGLYGHPLPQRVCRHGHTLPPTGTVAWTCAPTAVP